MIYVFLLTISDILSFFLVNLEEENTQMEDTTCSKSPPFINSTYPEQVAVMYHITYSPPFLNIVAPGQVAGIYNTYITLLINVL